MRLTSAAVFLSTAMLAAGTGAHAENAGPRQELKRVDLSGAPGMEVVLSVAEYKPGAELPAHFHHGVEAGYVIDGAMVEAPGKPAFELPAGAPIMNLRDVVHGGFKVVGDRTLKVVTVHVVDKGKPMYDRLEKK